MTEIFAFLKELFSVAILVLGEIFKKKKRDREAQEVYEKEVSAKMDQIKARLIEITRRSAEESNTAQDLERQREEDRKKAREKHDA